LQGLNKGCITFLRVRVARHGATREHTDAPHSVGLLRPRRQRPRRRTESREEDAPS
jgi:hypothetical protein